ncbi:TrkH family potassium uptake protein [Gloeocapsa sp. PCC 73106]|uniref:TrkH family potassium uptake protein n=1 Tax=Gloeocapsa sp. PCC 73106 TaxID=102232 RepID=UPI0002ABB0BD|nr:TrkH family potassium uptake protein [Gloeocapsa sp. PCC 73106]ELR96468.1 potassium uptake protein, TrkH family [Gloeocapsa sp. PCC 73106]
MTITRTICLGFLAIITIGTLLLMLPISITAGTWNSPINALFTATSAVCVTGLSMVDPGTYFSFWGQLTIALLAQVGGLGYMTTTTFLLLLVRRRCDLRQKIAMGESFDRPFLQGSNSLLISIISTTLIFELTGIILMLFVFQQEHGFKSALWLATFHSVSAWNNAGFSLFPDNLSSYRGSILINLVISVLIIFGGIGYQVIIEMYAWLVSYFKKDKARFIFSLNFKVVTSTTAFLLIIGTIGFLLSEARDPDTLANIPVQEKLLAAWFQSVTTRTAGFNTIDIGKMTAAGIFLSMALMFIGASPSGTGGGIKTTTLRIVFNATRSVLRGQEEVVMYRREVSVSLILKAVAVVFGSMMTVIASTLVMALVENNNAEINFLQILFESISAFGTVGLSMGITGKLSAWSQLVLILTMYLGRVGVILFMAAIIGDPRPNVIQYPPENLLVG